MKPSDIFEYENNGENLNAQANISYSQGVVYSKLGNFKKSLDYFQQSLNLYEKFYKYNFHSKIAECLNQLGDCCLKIYDYEKAEEYLNRCLNMRKNLEQTTNIELASIYHSFGNYYDLIGNIEKSYEFRKLSFEIRLEYLGEENRLTASSMNNLAICFLKMGNINESKKLFESTLQIRTKIHNDEPSNDIADSLFNLGVFYEKIGNFQTSLEYFQNSYEMRKLIHKDDLHFDLFESCLSLAKVHRRLGSTEQANSFEQAALDIRQNLNEENCLQEADLFYNMGIAYNKIGHSDKSIESFDQSYTIYKSLFKDKHLVVKNLVKNLSFIDCTSNFKWNYIQILNWFKDNKIDGDIIFYFMSSKINDRFFAELIEQSVKNKKLLETELKTQIGNVSDSDIDHFIFCLQSLNKLNE